MDLVAARYTTIADRGKYASFPAVRRELKHVCDAPPTSLHPLERKSYLETILGDLDPNGGAWITWPEDVHLIALTAVKVLGRNPVGSKEVLIQPDHLATLVFHTALAAQLPGITPLSPVPSSASSHSHSFSHSRGMSSPVAPMVGMGNELSSRSVQNGRVMPAAPTSRPALEALRALANCLTLHPLARQRAAHFGVGEAVAKALQLEVHQDRLFLLCRVGFLVTAKGTGAEAAIRAMVDDENVIPRLIHHLNSTIPIEANFDNVTELLKLIGNVLRHYPANPRGGFDPRLASLHWPILACMYQLEMRDLRPPLTHALNALFSIPFEPSNLSTWYSVPGSHPGAIALAPSRSNASSRPSTASSFKSNGSAPEKEQKKKKSIFGKKRSDSTATKAPIPTKGPVVTTEKLIIPLAEPVTAPSVQSLGADDAPRHIDIGALPRRIIDVLNAFIELNLPGSAPPAADLQLDDVLPPVLLLAANAAKGSEEMRHYFRGSLLPSDLDRSAKTGPLEGRPGLLGTLLRLLDNTTFVVTRDSAGELLWAMAGGDASVLCNEVGYGVVAGLLFRKGISGPPEAHLEAIDDAGEGVLPAPHVQYAGTGQQTLHPFAAGGGRSNSAHLTSMRSNTPSPGPPPLARPPVSPRASPSPRAHPTMTTRPPISPSMHPWAGPPALSPHSTSPHAQLKESSYPFPDVRQHAARHDARHDPRNDIRQPRYGPRHDSNHDPRPDSRGTEASYAHPREASRPSSHTSSNGQYASYLQSPPSALPRQLPPQPLPPTQLPYAAPQPYMQPLPPPPSRPAPLPTGPLPPPPERHPITGLNREPDGPSPFAGLSDAEREREAEKMFVLFERLERNPILKAGAPTPDGGHRGLKEEMSARVQSGDADLWERNDMERERRAREAQEAEDEREAMAELARYRQRRGK